MQAVCDAKAMMMLDNKGRNEIVHSRLLPVLKGGYLGSSWWHASFLQDARAQQLMRDASDGQSAAMAHHIMHMKGGLCI